MQKVKVPTALEQIESKINEFVDEWEPGSGCEIKIEMDELFLEANDPYEIIKITQHLELITDFKMSDGVITLEIHEGLLEHLYNSRENDWGHESELDRQGWLDSRGVI